MLGVNLTEPWLFNSDVPLHSSDAPDFTSRGKDSVTLGEGSPASSTTIKDSGVRSGSGGGISSSLLGEVASTTVSWFNGEEKLVRVLAIKESCGLQEEKEVVEEAGNRASEVAPSCFSGRSKDILESALFGGDDEK